MGRYIEQSDLENFWGAEQVSGVTGWSRMSDDELDSTVTQRITDSITAGEDLIDDYLRDSRYAVPISGTWKTSGGFKLYVSIFAGLVLYMRRGLMDSPQPGLVATTLNKVASLKKWADDELVQITRGYRRVNATLSHSGPTAPHVVTRFKDNNNACCGQSQNNY